MTCLETWKPTHSKYFTSSTADCTITPWKYDSNLNNCLSVSVLQDAQFKSEQPEALPGHLVPWKDKNSEDGQIFLTWASTAPEMRSEEMQTITLMWIECSKL